jgi:3-oxoacyl-(acyl-carrier-protein) synthase
VKRVVITGMGSVTPAGVGVDRLWDHVLSGTACTRSIDRFDASRYACQVAGQADAFSALDWLPFRFVKRTDRFTHLALVAVQEALEDACVTVGGPGGPRPDRIGVMVGNVLGGWEFAERELRTLWVEGPRQLSPYQATAWFPAAPQGNICIRFGIKGRARTFVCDRASGTYAVIHGAETIRRGQADVVLAGGTEQPLSPYAWLCCHTSGYLTRHANERPAAAYRPFDRGHTGMVLGEGATFLVLEELGHARARGARIWGELRSWAVTSDAYRPAYTMDPTARTLSLAVTKALDQAMLAPEALGCLFAHGSAVPAEDSIEVRAIRIALGPSADHVPVSVPKAAIGHLLGAAAPTDMAIALRAMSSGRVPPTANLSNPAPGFELDFVRTAPRGLPGWDHTLVMSQGLGGVNACVLMGRTVE